MHTQNTSMLKVPTEHLQYIPCIRKALSTVQCLFTLHALQLLDVVSVLLWVDKYTVLYQ